MDHAKRKSFSIDRKFWKKLNIFTLSFKDNLEDDFQEEYFNSSLILIRLSFFGGLLYYSTFSILDAIVLPQFLSKLIIMRMLIVGPVILAVILLSFTKGFKKWWQPGIAFVTVVAGIAIAVMTLLPDEITSNSYYVGMILVLIYCYMLVRMRFIWSTLAGIIIVFTYAITLHYSPDIPREIKITNMYFLIAANILGMFAGYAIEYYTRRGFYYSYLLRLESEKVKQANLELDNKVKEKTIELEKDLELRIATEKELIVAIERAEESDRLKSAFLANMSHEIRTPMNGIMGFSDLLNKPDIDPDQIHKYTSIIKKSGRRMLDTINDLIDIAKIEAGLEKLHITEENVNLLLQDLFEFFLPEAESKGIGLKFSTRISDEFQRIHTDREKINSILTNLLKNAIKYTEKGSIEYGVSSEQSGQLLHFFIKDTGIGISPDNITKIFDRFVREEGNKKALYEGSGLGLSITKSYISMLGGKIWVNSTVGEGTEFTFTIPVSTLSDGEEIITGPNSLKNMLETKKKNLKVLVAEDEEISLFYLTEILKEHFGNILTATNGKDVVDLVKANEDIDLVLMDIRMPLKDGYEATREIRKFNKDVKIIAQTAYALKDDRQAAFDAGCNECVTKPIDETDLFNKINEVLR